MRRACLTIALLAGSLAHASGVLGDRFTHFAGFDLGRTTLANVQQVLGDSPVRESGDGHEHEVSVCYSTASGEVRFKSGELGGGTDLLGFTVRQSTSAVACPKARRPLTMEISGLKPGLTRRKFQEIVGTDIRWERDTGTAMFESRATVAGQPPLDVLITVTGAFSGDRLVEFSVWKIETI